MTLDLFDFNNPPEILDVKVTPKAKSERVKKEVKEDGTVLYRVHVTVAPECGKANEAVIALLAKTFGIAKAHVHITHGHRSREKRIKIDQKAWS